MLSIARVAALAPLALSTLAFGQTAPLSFKASPEVYKVLAENDQFRVVLATWKPGQKDIQHSHPATAVYRLTECKARLTGPDGKVLGEGTAPAGTAVLQDAIASHALENTGTTDCQVLIVERK